MVNLTKHQREFILASFKSLDCTFESNSKAWQEIVREDCVYNETDGKYSWWRRGVELKFEYVCYDKLFQHLFKYAIEMCRFLSDENLVRIINPEETSEEQIKQIAHDVRKLWKSNVQTRFATCCNLWGKQNNFSCLNKRLMELIGVFNTEFNQVDEPESEDEYDDEDEDDDVEMIDNEAQTTQKLQPISQLLEQTKNQEQQQPQQQPETTLTDLLKEFIMLAFDVVDGSFDQENTWREIMKDEVTWRTGEELQQAFICYDKLFMFVFRYGIETRNSDNIRNLLDGIEMGWRQPMEAVKEIRDFYAYTIGKRFNVCCEHWMTQDVLVEINRRITGHMNYFNANFNNSDDEDEDDDILFSDNDDDRDNQIIGKKRSRTKRFYEESDSDDEDDDDEIQPKKKKKKRRHKSTGMNILDAARQILREDGGSLHGKVIATRILEQGLVRSNNPNFRAAVTAQIYTDIKKKGNTSDFEKTGGMIFKFRRQQQQPIEIQIPVYDDEN